MVVGAQPVRRARDGGDLGRRHVPVEVQCGAHRIVSLISSEAVQELGLAPGVLAVASVKSTNVVIETPKT